MSDEGGPELDDRHLTNLRERVERSEFHRWAGLELVSIGHGAAEVRLELQPHHFNPQGLLHGGMIGTLADTAIGLALRSRMRPGLTHRTAQLNVHFLQKSEGGTIVCRGRSLHVGRRMGYGEADVLDSREMLLARATGTFIILPAPGAF